MTTKVKTPTFTLTMSSQNNETGVMKELLLEQKSLFQLPKMGDVVEGTVIGKESGMLFVDLGIIGTGIVYGAEYFKVQDEIKHLKPGDRIVAKLVELENEDGYRELSLKKAKEEKNWQHMQEKQRNREPIEVKISDANKGGLMAEVEGLIGFLPVSQLTPAHYPRVEGGDKNKILNELKKFVGTELKVHVLDANQKENKLIFSEKEAENETIQIALGKYKVGDTIEGEITGVVDFGAFIKFDPMLEGLIHISELDWSLVQNPHDIINVGDTVKAKITDIAADGKVSLSLKALKENPWEGIGEKIKEGDTLEGEVTQIHSYGALVKIKEGVLALVHVSEFSTEEGSASGEESAEDELRKRLKEGKTYTFQVKSIEPEEYKIALKLAS